MEAEQNSDLGIIREIGDLPAEAVIFDRRLEQQRKRQARRRF